MTEHAEPQQQGLVVMDEPEFATEDITVGDVAREMQSLGIPVYTHVDTSLDAQQGRGRSNWRRFKVAIAEMYANGCASQAYLFMLVVRLLNLKPEARDRGIRHIVNELALVLYVEKKRASGVADFTGYKRITAVQ
jgi:hypothetical protein